jgi:anaerobic selenocysteine-containing dehydrogenase
MDRRVFFRILSTASAASVTSGCGSGVKKLMPLLVPDHEIVPGEEQWHPAVCTSCEAGCGTLVRVMEGRRITIDRGEQVRERVAAIKKIEGNPLDPVSGGRLCAKGQAAVQGLYHPDRLRGPMKRIGPRGSGQFTQVSWTEAVAMAGQSLAKVDPSKIAFLTRGSAGSRSTAFEQFAKAWKAPAPFAFSITGHPVERKAAELVFGWKGQPVYDLANAHSVLGVGADFLGGWTSPVYYARQFGDFRQGRREVRGRLVQAESRLSITAAAADRWLPVRPGTEVQFLAAVGRILIDGNLAPHQKDLPKAAAAVFASANVGALLAQCGLQEKRVFQVVRDLGESAAPLVIGGASIVQANSLDAVIASHYINLMLGNVGKRGGVLAPAREAMAPLENHRFAEALSQAQLVIIDDANPAYTFPRSSGVLDALQRATVISFAPFLDDSSAYADLILPSHHPLESEVAVAPAVSNRTAIAVGTPFVRPLYDTRSTEEILAALAEAMQISYSAANIKELLQSQVTEELTIGDILRQGGVWSEEHTAPAPRISNARFETANASAPGGTAQFPLELQPYISLQHHDGSASNLPWMQELPDPVSSSIWGLPVELDPKTAAGLRVANGDIVRVESPHGAIEAPAYIHPGAIPGVVSMPIGDGHTHYGRYASGRGANPLSILAPVFEKSTGALVLGGTRVRLSRVGDRKGWIQFSAPDREERDDHR